MIIEVLIGFSTSETRLRIVTGEGTKMKQYRKSIHSWSYGRLIDSIKACAVQAGIAIEEGKQQGIGSPQEKARNLAISTYNSRTKVII